jgi:hypothetical protein
MEILPNIKEFPESLSLYNIGIKDRKIQHSTMESVKYLDNMKNELNDIIVANAVDK